MALTTLLQKLRENSLALLTTSLIVGLVGILVARSLNPSYTAHLTVYVQKPIETPGTQTYTYDGYYAQQSAEAYTDTVVGLSESRSVISRAVETLGGETGTDLKRFTDAVEVEKTAPQLVTLSVTLEAPDKSAAFIQALFLEVQKQVREQEKEIGFSADLVDEAPLVTANKVPVTLIGVVAALLTAAVGVSIIFLREYLREND